MRAWILRVAVTDAKAALRVNAEMGCEAVSDRELSLAADGARCTGHIEHGYLSHNGDTCPVHEAANV
jgi:hypothetical protein